jgi:methoxymalonate biosynthesis protein
LIKCVIWDLDNTLFAGVYLESADQRPPANAEVLPVLTEFASRGILAAIASRNPPEAAAYASQLTRQPFAAVRCGWGAKSAAITGILAELGLEAAEAAFIDDDALERAEVSFSIPALLVLAPEDAAGAADWPDFSPAVSTAEGRRRGELYQHRRARQEEAAAFGGSQAEFLRHSGTRVRIAWAQPADLDRLHELSARTHQFNSAAVQVSVATFAQLLAADDQRLVTVRLSDNFGDDGLVGGCVLTERADWQVPLLMMSCRAIGRGVIGPVLSWICLAAGAAAVSEVALDCVINPRNVPLRIALTTAGFRVDGEPDQPSWAQSGGRVARYLRRLDQPVEPLPDWVTQVPA